VGTTGDPDTPYPDAVALAGTLSAAKLVTFRGEGHTAFLRSACVTAQVVNYLVDLVLPGKELCADERPAAPARGTRAAATTVTPAAPPPARGGSAWRRPACACPAPARTG
jgi:hypothetical protein